MTMQLEDRLWEQLEAAAEREAGRGRITRGGAALRGRLPAHGVLALAAVVALVVFAVAATAIPEREQVSRIKRFGVAGARLGPGVLADGALWSFDGRSGQVLRIDPRSRRVVGRVALPEAVDEVALAAGDGAVWAVPSSPVRHSSPAPAHPRPVELLRIDPRTNAVTVRIELRAPDGSTLRPVGLVARPNAVWVWGEGGVQRVDPLRARVAGAISLPGEKVLGFAVTETRVLVATDLAELVSFDARTSERLGAVPFDGPPSGTQLAPVGDAVVLYRRGGTLACVDPVTGRDRWALHLGSQPRDLVLAGGRLWVLFGGPTSREDELRAIDPGSGRAVARFGVPTDDARALVPTVAIPLVMTQGGDVIRLRPLP